MFNSCLLYLVVPILSKYLWFCAKMSQAALVHMSFPDILPPFAWAGVCRRKGLPRNVALGPGTKKKPKSPKSARRPKAENPKE